MADQNPQNPFLRLDNTTDNLVLGLSDADVGVVSQGIEDKFQYYDNLLKQRDLTPEEQTDLDNTIQAKQDLLEALRTDSRIENCFSRETTGKSWTFKNTPECEDFSHTTLFKETQSLLNKTRDLPDPCGTSTLSQVDTALLTFFETLKGIKKYGELYINGTLSKLTKITNLIAHTGDIIAAILKILVQRIRSWLLNLIRKLIEQVVDKILNTLAKMFKDTIVEEIVKAIICKFDEIIKGLAKLVTDFLFALLQNVINPVFCAVEQFTNALINNLTAQIDRAIKPILNSINDILGGVAQVAGSVFQAIDFILGFENFLCQKPNCPDIKKFKASAWGGPSQSQIDSFNKFGEVPDSGQVIDQADQWIGGLSVFGEKLKDVPDAGPLNCNTNPYRCGPPQVQIFGGGGAGAVADAVVNTIGEVIGVNLFYGGRGYTSPPYVTFYDSCGNGNYASAYSEINDNGEVIRIIIVNPGGGYLNTPSNTDEFGNPIVPGSNTNPGEGGGTTTTPTRNPDGTAGITTSLSGNPIPPLDQETIVKQYVGCLDEVQVISTGIGYQPTDTITIRPDIPNLQAGVKLTEEGQIIQIQLITKPCGLQEIPEITINSATGSGAVFRPVIRVQRIETFNPNESFDPKKLIKVIDCVGK